MLLCCYHYDCSVDLSILRIWPIIKSLLLQFLCLGWTALNRLRLEKTIKSSSVLYKSQRVMYMGLSSGQRIGFALDEALSRSWLWILMISICYLAWAISHHCLARDRMFSSTNLRPNNTAHMSALTSASGMPRVLCSLKINFLEMKQGLTGRSNKMPSEKETVSVIFRKFYSDWCWQGACASKNWD